MKVELVTNLKHHATKILADLRALKEPLLITRRSRHNKLTSTARGLLTFVGMTVASTGVTQHNRPEAT